LTNLGKRGIGLEVPVGFHLEERGRMIFTEQLKSLVIAKVESFKLEFIVTLLNTRSEYELMLEDPSNQIARSELFKLRVELVGIINKKANAMYKACDIVRKRVAQVEGGYVDTIVMNEKINAHERLVRPENTDDYLAGHLPYDYKNALDRRDAIMQFEEYIACVQRALNVSEKKPVDLFETKMEIGMHHIIYDKKRNRDGIFKTDYLTIRVVDNEKNRLAYITVLDCINNCLLGMDTGSVTMNGEPTDNSPLTSERTLEQEIGSTADNQPKMGNRSHEDQREYMGHQALLNNVSLNYQTVFNSIDDGTASGMLRAFDMLSTVAGKSLQDQQQELNAASSVLFGVPYNGQKGPYSAEEYKEMLLGATRLVMFLGQVAPTHRYLVLKHLFNKFGSDRQTLENLVLLRADLLFKQNITADANQWNQAKMDILADDLKHVKSILPTIFGYLIDDLATALKTGEGGRTAYQQRVSTLSYISPSDPAKENAILRDIINEYLGEPTLKQIVTGNEWLNAVITVLLRLKVKDALKMFAKYNIPPPFAWIVHREAELSVSALLWVARDGKTANRYTTRDIFTLGQNATSQRIWGHLTCHGGTEVHTPKNLFYEPAAMINAITRGMNAAFYTTTETGRLNYNPSEGKYGTSNQDSVKVFMIRYWEVEKLPNPFNLTGADPDKIQNVLTHESRIDGLHYSTAEFYNNWWSFKQNEMEGELDPLVKTYFAAPTNESWEGYTERYDSTVGSYDDKQLQTGHLEDMPMWKNLRDADRMNHGSDSHHNAGIKAF
jgi:hypothetical protein